MNNDVKRFPVPENLLGASGWHYEGGGEIPTVLCVFAAEHDLAIADRDNCFSIMKDGYSMEVEHLNEAIRERDERIAKLKSALKECWHLMEDQRNDGGPASRWEYEMDKLIKKTLKDVIK